MKNPRITKPAIEVGFQSGDRQATVNGQTWDSTNRVAGAQYAANASVIMVRTGRKLVGVGSGGIYPARTTT